jgi:hypothetical protein
MIPPVVNDHVRHNFNEDLGHKGFPMAQTNWNSGPVFDAWSSYAQVAFGMYHPIFASTHQGLPSIVDSDLADVPVKEKTNRSDIKLPLDKNGLPILLDLL